MVISGLLQSLLNLEFHQKLSTTIWKHETSFCKDHQRPSKTVSDWVTGIDPRSISVTINDHERLPMILLFHFCYMETKQTNFGNCQRPRKTVNNWQRVSLVPKVAI